MIEQNHAFHEVNDAFPRIGKAILTFWGHRDFYEFMNGLQQQERDGKARAGFPMNVMLALFNLTSEHDQAFPELAPRQSMFR